MARKAFAATLGQSLGEGRFNTDAAGHPSIAVSIAAVAALQAAVDDAVVAALADVTISGDPTALGLVEDIETAFAAYVAAVTATDTASTAKNLVVDFDDEVITSRNALKAALRAIEQTAEGSGL